MSAHWRKQNKMSYYKLCSFRTPLCTICSAETSQISLIIPCLNWCVFGSLVLWIWFVLLIFYLFILSYVYLIGNKHFWHGIHFGCAENVWNTADWPHLDQTVFTVYTCSDESCCWHILHCFVCIFVSMSVYLWSIFVVILILQMLQNVGQEELSIWNNVIPIFLNVYRLYMLV